MAEKYIPLSAAVDEMKSWEQENKCYHPEDYEDEEQEEPGIPVLEAIERLNSIPPADVRPVVRGEWIGYPDCLQFINAYSDDHIVCSACEECFSILDNDTGRFNFCPNCGADMRPEPPEREVEA